MKKRYSEEQIIGFLKEADAGLAIKELCLRLRRSVLSVEKKLSMAALIQQAGTVGVR